MSMLGCAGASAATGEILSLIREKIAQNNKDRKIVEVLREIEKKTMEIKESADEGWY